MRRPAPIIRLASSLGVARPGLMTELAAALGIGVSAVSQWRRVPPERVPAVASILGVGRHQLRPDLWEPPCSSSPTAIIPDPP